MRTKRHQVRPSTLGTRLLAGIVALAAAELTTAQIVIRVDANGPTNPNPTGANWTTDVFNNLADALDYATLPDGPPASVERQLWLRQGVYYVDPTAPLGATFYFPNKISVYGGFKPGEDTIAARSGAITSTVLSGDVDRSGTLTQGDARHVVMLTSYSPNPGVLNNTTEATFDRLTIEGGNAAWHNPTLDPALPYEATRGGGILITGVELPQNGVEGVKFCHFRDLIVRNSFAETHGGGACLKYMQGCTFENVTFTNNACVGSLQRSGHGGGFFLRDTETDPEKNGYDITAFHNCVISDNKALFGGGIAIARLQGDVSLANCLIHSNEASRGGGLITQLSSGGTLTASNCTIANNVVRRPAGYDPRCGAGIFVSQRSGQTMINLCNSIVYGNLSHVAGGSGAAIRNDIEGPGASGTLPNILARYCVVSHPVMPLGSLTPPYFGVGNLLSDPRFIKPSARNFRLQATSPAINAGSDDLLAYDWTDLDRNGLGFPQFVPFDLDFASREVDAAGATGIGVDGGEVPGAIVDIGAYEHQ